MVRISLFDTNVSGNLPATQPQSRIISQNVMRRNQNDSVCDINSYSLESIINQYQIVQGSVEIESILEACRTMANGLRTGKIYSSIFMNGMWLKLVKISFTVLQCTCEIVPVVSSWFVFTRYKERKNIMK